MAFNYLTWGDSWGSSWGNYWGLGGAPTVVIDTHDGGKQQRKRWEEQRQSRERLRRQIRQAIEGPEATILAPALERVAKSGPEPIEERIDFDELLEKVELWKAVRKAADDYAALERAIEEDDEDILLLL